MVKKNKKTDTILKRAEKLFKAGNFVFAEKEFEKARKKLNSDEIIEKLEICRKETRVIKGKELVKQGRKAASNNKLPEAIAFFQGAEKFLNDPWLAHKIKELQDKLNRHKIDAQAREAEIAHDYSGASDFYAKAWEKTGDQGLLLKSALNFVKAEKYVQAATRFQKLDVWDDNAVYHYGFALAKIGKSYEALKQWEKLESHDKGFMEQNRLVLSLACSDLYSSLEKEPDINGGYDRANDLLDLARALEITELIPTLQNIYSYYKLIVIETLWKQEKFTAIADILLQMPLSDDPAILGLNAKTYFYLSREEPGFLEPLMTFWLTAVYSREISARFSDSLDKRQKVQQRLIRFAEEQINRQQDSAYALHAASLLEIEKKLLKDLLAVSQQDHQKFDQVCTPRYALISGLSGIILDLIKQNKNYFKDQEHYLETGGYYSRAMEGLYALRTGDVKKALSLIESISPGDEFTDYVVSLVQFEYGQVALENNEKDYLQYFALTSKLFESVPFIEKRFADKILQLSWNKKIAYGKLLAFLHKQRQSDPIAEALASVMTQVAVTNCNRGRITNKQMAAAIEKALKIDSDNEFALHTLKQANIGLEVETICTSLNKNKLNKAARLARQSRYPEVCDKYFEYNGQMVNQVTSSGVNPNIQKMLLQEMVTACMTVDPDHPVVYSIKEKLQILGN
jgi:hypothetical protein